MTRRRIVLLDCDGVLADFIAANLRSLAQIDVHRRPEDVTSYRIEDCLGLDHDQQLYMKRAWSRPGFAASMLPYEGAVDGVRMLRELADVYVVTAPMWSSHTWQYERVEWLRDHFGFDREQIVSTPAKHLVQGDVLVDDRIDVLERWCAQDWCLGTPVLWRQPYNEASPWPEGFGLIRTNSWQAVASLVNPQPEDLLWTSSATRA